MELCKYLPTPSDRMGALWALTPIDNIFVIEYGPAGTTHFAIEGVFGLGSDSKMNVYTTHMSDADVTFGNTDKLKGAVLEIKEKFFPETIFIFGSSVSSLIGTDIESFCLDMEEETGITLISVNTGGYAGDFNVGVEQILTIIANKIIKEPVRKKSKTYNIIGSTIDSYNFLSDKTELEAILLDVFTLTLNTCFTSFSDFNSLKSASEAEFNFVIRAEGLEAAEIMKKRFGIPYIYLKPYGYGCTLKWISDINEKFNLEINKSSLLKRAADLKKNISTFYSVTSGLKNKDVFIYGDYDTALGIAYMVEEIGLNPKCITVNHDCTETIKKCISACKFKDIIFKPSEEDIKRIFEENPFYLALGNKFVKDTDKSKNFILASNPNIDAYSFYPYLPLVGFNGQMQMLQTLMNRLSN